MIDEVDGVTYEGGWGDIRGVIDGGGAGGDGAWLLWQNINWASRIPPQNCNTKLHGGFEINISHVIQNNISLIV